ncbi:hypothetical protein KAU19_00765 [Candidatus Parcubacteria bacterium]|nr:hypothetical protein [Candidatus Parcubacteria bacterium]
MSSKFLKKFYFLVSFFVVMIIFCFFYIGDSNITYSLNPECYHECRLTDSPICVDNWAQKCGNCDSDKFNEWCNDINCSPGFCFNGECQVSGPVCNDGFCDTGGGECSSCPQDCAITECCGQNGCNSGLQDGDENCSNCWADCSCADGITCCIGGACVTVCNDSDDCCPAGCTSVNDTDCITSSCFFNFNFPCIF